jgi:AmiR/NasT family two-component response regulator
MKRPRPILNFRGLHALLLLPPDENAAALERTLQRLGLSMSRHDLTETCHLSNDQIDIVFADVDAWEVPPLPDSIESYPVVALIGHETPTRLLRAYEIAANAFLLKPVRTQGIFAAIFLALNEHRQHECLQNKIDDVSARHAARRDVIKAILLIMNQYDLDEDAAFHRLRQESMARRRTIEDLSAEIVRRASKLDSCQQSAQG